jgi:hypothetical protein
MKNCGDLMAVFKLRSEYRTLLEFLSFFTFFYQFILTILGGVYK